MRLLNRTPLPDSALYDLLVKAGRSVSASTTGVVVQVNPSYRAFNRASGMAYRCDSVGWGRSKRWLSTSGGAFRISLPLLYLKHSDRNTDLVSVAESFLQVARHEWGHIRDYQNKLESSRRGPGGRRPPHDSRPEEIRAENYIYDSDKKLPTYYFDDVVLELAVSWKHSSSQGEGGLPDEHATDERT